MWKGNLNEFLEVSKSQSFTYVAVYVYPDLYLTFTINKDEGNSNDRDKQNNNLNSDLKTFISKHPGAYQLRARKTQSHGKEFDQYYVIDTISNQAQTSDTLGGTHESPAAMEARIIERLERKQEIEELKDIVSRNQDLYSNIGEILKMCVPQVMDKLGLKRVGTNLQGTEQEQTDRPPGREQSECPVTKT